MNTRELIHTLRCCQIACESSYEWVPTSSPEYATIRAAHDHINWTLATLKPNPHNDRPR